MFYLFFIKFLIIYEAFTMFLEVSIYDYFYFIIQLFVLTNRLYCQSVACHTCVRGVQMPRAFGLRGPIIVQINKYSFLRKNKK